MKLTLFNTTIENEYLNSILIRGIIYNTISANFDFKINDMSFIYNIKKTSSGDSITLSLRAYDDTTKYVINYVDRAAYASIFPITTENFFQKVTTNFLIEIEKNGELGYPFYLLKYSLLS